MMPPTTRRDSPVLDLGTLRIFLAVAATGSMTRAARDLGLTQPAASQAVARLEGDLGALLVDRSTRPLGLTPAGEELRVRARRLITDAERLLAEVRDMADATLPRVRIGLIDSFAATVGPELIKNLRSHARQLSVWSGISPNLGDDLLHRKLDLVVTTDPMEGLGGVERHRLLREPFVLVLPRRMAAAMPDVRLDELARNHPFVRYSVRSLIGARIDRHLARLGIDAPRTLEFDGTESVFAMVAAGVGWAITTPVCLIHGGASRLPLRAVPLPGPSFSRSVHLLGREGEFGAFPRRVCKHTRDILRAMMARHLPAVAPWAAKGTIVG